MEVILFRPRHRQDWIERLRKKGWIVRVVHEAHKVRGQLVVIDAVDGNWERFLPLFIQKGITVYLLVDNFNRDMEELTVLGISKMITTADEPEWEEKEPPVHKDRQSPVSVEERQPPDPAPLSQRMKHKESLVEVASFREGEQEAPHIPLRERAEDAEARYLESPVHAESITSKVRIPSIVTVYAAKGGVGRTVFLLNLAAILSEHGYNVCILDLDPVYGTIASTLQLQPDRTIVDLIRRMEDRTASQACLLQTEMGFRIVAAPLEIGSIALTQENVLGILQFLKTEADVVLIDMPVRLDPATQLVMEQSEQLLLMTTDEWPSIHNLMKIKPLLSGLRPSPEILSILNRSSGHLSQEKWREMFPWPLVLELPEDEAVAKAARQGECLLPKGSLYVQQMKEWVDRWVGNEPEEHRKKRSSFFLFLSK